MTPSFPRPRLTGLLLAGIAAGALAAPGAAQPLTGDGTVPCGRSYTVAGGDTLSRISARAYGDPLLFGFIADANWDALRSDPERIAVGMSLAVPCVDASGTVLTPEEVAKATASLEGVVAAEGPLTADQLDTLFGPLALFPDTLLTSALVATTFPLDVVRAARFVEETTDLPDSDRADQAAEQPWDDSVRELAAGFPEVVTRLSDNIDWTEQAGEAVVAQTDEVLAAIQRLRTKAQENGYLVDNDAQQIEQVNETIVIAPANPNVVYVPTYDPQVVYSTPVTGVPVYQYGYDYYDDDVDWGDALVAGGILLGSAVILDEIFDDDDWGDWDLNDDIDWDRGDITIDRGDVDIDIDRGDRVSIGGGDRISIGDTDRVQIDRGERAGLGAAAGAAGAAGAVAASRRSLSSATTREAARQKITEREATSTWPARLEPSRSSALSSRSSAASTRSQATASRASSSYRSSDRSASISRPSATRTPSYSSHSRSTSFSSPSSGYRASVSSSRGRSSMSRSSFSRSGGGGGGGFRRR